MNKCKHDIVFTISRYGGPTCVLCENGRLEAERDAAIKEVGVWSRKVDWLEAELEDLRNTVQIDCNPPDACNDPVVLKNYMRACLEQARKGGELK